MSGKRLQDNTKQLLFQALKECVTDKPIEKVTISELTRAAGINRKTFYYHFDSVRDLCLWAYRTAAATMEGKSNLKDSRGTLTNGFTYMLGKEQLFYRRLFEYLSPEELYQATVLLEDNSMRSEVDRITREMGLTVTEKDRQLLTEFFVESYARVVSQCFRGETEWETEELIRFLSILWDSAIPAALDALAKDRLRQSAAWGNRVLFRG